MAWYNLSPRRRVWYVLPRKMRNSPSVPKLRARDPEGVEAGAGVCGGRDYCRVVFVCPHPHILPTQLQLPPHPAQPGAGSSCGGTRTRDRSGTFRCPSAPGASALVRVLVPGTLILSLGTTVPHEP